MTNSTSIKSSRKPEPHFGTYVGTIHTYCPSFNYKENIIITIDLNGHVSITPVSEGTLTDGTLRKDGSVAGLSISVYSLSRGNLTIPYSVVFGSHTMSATGSSGDITSQISVSLKSSPIREDAGSAVQLYKTGTIASTISVVDDSYWVLHYINDLENIAKSGLLSSIKVTHGSQLDITPAELSRDATALGKLIGGLTLAVRPSHSSTLSGVAGQKNELVLGGNSTDYTIAHSTAGKYWVIDNRPDAPDGVDLVSDFQLVKYSNGLKPFQLTTRPSVQVISRGVSSSGLVISAGDQLEVLSGGSVHATTVIGGGTTYLCAGAQASRVTVSSGGVEFVQSGGFASGTVLSAGGHDVNYGRTVATLAVLGASATVGSGGKDSGTIVHSGGAEIVLSGGTASGTVVRSGGIQSVKVGGATFGTVLSRGKEYVSSGGLAVGTIISGGGSVVDYAGGTVSKVTVTAGAELTVASGATVIGANLVRGIETVSAGGIVSGTTTFGTRATLEAAPNTGATLFTSGFKATDTIDLADFNADASLKHSFLENATKTRGVLTMTEGDLNVRITLFGQYVAGGFHFNNDAAGGTAITYAVSSSAHAELAGH
jgi:autotransporter passenger strand-loop-strand repeat protein